MTLYRAEQLPRRRALNTGDEEREIRDQFIPWMKRRMGGDVRVIEEIALGRRRADLMFVAPADVVVAEIKGPRDSLDRLDDQITEYEFYAPEVWLVVCRKWANDRKVRCARNIAVVPDDVDPSAVPVRRRPFRDELSVARLLWLLHQEEAARIAQRTGVIPGPALSGAPRQKIRALLARILTGNEIMREVCTELRCRTLVGVASEDVIRPHGTIASSGDPPAGRL